MTSTIHTYASLNNRFRRAMASPRFNTRYILLTELKAVIELEPIKREDIPTAMVLWALVRDAIKRMDEAKQVQYAV